jgi:hypothetical protein
MTVFKKWEEEGSTGFAFLFDDGKRFSGVFGVLIFAFLAGGPADDEWSVAAFFGVVRLRLFFFVSPSPPLCKK